MTERRQSDRAHDWYAARRTETVRWLRRSAVLAVPAIAIAWVLTGFAYPAAGWQRIGPVLAVVAWSGVAVVATRLRRVQAWGGVAAVVYHLGMAALVALLVADVNGGWDAVSVPTALAMVTSALVMPWGVRAQAAVSAGWVAVCLLATSPPAAEGSVAKVAIVLAESFLLSLLGAWALDRQRRVTWQHARRVAAKHRQVRALARQRERLLDASRVLNEAVANDDLFARISRVASELVGAEACLTLVDELQQECHIVSVAGGFHDCAGVTYRPDAIRPSLAAIRAADVLEIPDDTRNESPPAWFTSAGIGRALFVPIERDFRLLGHLSFSYPAPNTQRFSEAQKRLASTLAHQVAIALTNARLVEELKEASQLKSHFVSTMSHELRTPLNVIIGYGEMLEEPRGLDIPGVARRIRRAGNELLELIEATLDLGRLEAGRDVPRVERVGVRDLWEQLAADFSGVSCRPGVHLRWEPVNGAQMHTDPRKLRIIVKNLVGNAVKFTHQGEIVARFDVVDGGRACVTVRDTGIGIPHDQLPAIFDMFRQVDSSDRRAHGGVGLGLYIVSQFAKQLGGTVRVESELGRGSTFQVELPLRAPSAA